jgi:hypothetical protein
VAARDELRAAVATFSRPCASADSAAARAQLERVQPRVAALTVRRPAEGAPRAVRAVRVDGVDATVKAGAAIEVDPGRHVVQLIFAEGPPAQVEVSVGDGERREVAAPDAAAPPPSGAAPAPEPSSGATPPRPMPVESPPPSPPPASSGTRTLGWVALGGGAALLVAGGVFWGLRQHEVDTLSGQCHPGARDCPASSQSDIDRGHAYDALGVTGFVAGGAAVLAGAGLVLFGGGHAAPAAARVIPLVLARGGGVGLEGALW